MTGDALLVFHQPEICTVRRQKTTAAKVMFLSGDQIHRRAAAGIFSSEEISEQTVSEALYTAGCPDPDLLIRTSGEQRLSNFLLWQAAYAELFFTPVLWPDFTEEDFAQALDEYARRERRFGLVKNNERIR